MLDRLDTALANTKAHLLSLQCKDGHWEGQLSSSALSTATAIVALHGVDPYKHAALIKAGVHWLVANQNMDGGWGDTTISQSNLSTTLLCWSALRLCGEAEKMAGEAWILKQVGSLEPEAITRAVISRYGKDKTFSVPILMLCTICGTMGSNAWRRVLPLPFELAALPRRLFGAVGMPVVSYALPALIAIGYARFKNAPPRRWNPLRWIRSALWRQILPMLKTLQPSSGGYLEATPLTSFVAMALAAAGEKEHLCIPGAVAFLSRSMRADGGWPIDTNLATWGTTLATKALGQLTPETLEWLLKQQYKEIHPFTNAAPGGWAWTDLPGGVPDADDTAGALISLKLCGAQARQAASAGIQWLLDLQNRDGGMPTFCRGWGTLPFDRSTPELTAHALLAWWTWRPDMPRAVQNHIQKSTQKCLMYLEREQTASGSWIPLWFGNENTVGEDNPVYGTAQVVAYLCGEVTLAQQADALIQRGVGYLLRQQQACGGWGGDVSAPVTIEETAVTLHALCQAAKGGCADVSHETILRGVIWLLEATREGTYFPASPIGLYFARLWYHEQLYPIVWTAQALAASGGRAPAFHGEASGAKSTGIISE